LVPPIYAPVAQLAEQVAVYLTLSILYEKINE